MLGVCVAQPEPLDSARECSVWGKIKILRGYLFLAPLFWGLFPPPLLKGFFFPPPRDYPFKSLFVFFTHFIKDYILYVQKVKNFAFHYMEKKLHNHNQPFSFLKIYPNFSFKIQN